MTFLASLMALSTSFLLTGSVSHNKHTHTHIHSVNNRKLLKVLKNKCNNTLTISHNPSCQTIKRYKWMVMNFNVSEMMEIILYNCRALVCSPAVTCPSTNTHSPTVRIHSTRAISAKHTHAHAYTWTTIIKKHTKMLQIKQPPQRTVSFQHSTSNAFHRV